MTAVLPGCVEFFASKLQTVDLQIVLIASGENHIYIHFFKARSRFEACKLYIYIYICVHFC